MEIAVNWLPQVAFWYLLIVARVGTMLMLVPAFGERLVAARLRLAFMLVFCLVLFPVISPMLPAQPDGLLEAIVLLLHEIAVGLILGGVARLIVSSAQTAGAIIAFQSGLSVAQTADPAQPGVQGALIGNFLGMVALALVFATDLHHLVLAAVYNSYMVYDPTTPLMFGDASILAWEVAARSFAVGVQMSAPFIVFGLVFFLGLGILSKLMPQLQVFFIAMPANIGLGFLLLMALLSVMMMWYLTHFENEIRLLMGG